MADDVVFRVSYQDAGVVAALARQVDLEEKLQDAIGKVNAAGKAQAATFKQGLMAERAAYEERKRIWAGAEKEFEASERKKDAEYRDRLRRWTAAEDQFARDQVRAREKREAAEKKEALQRQNMGFLERNLGPKGAAMVASGVGAAAGMVGIGSLTGALTALKNTIDAERQRQLNLAAKAEGIAASMRTFEGLQDAGPEGEAGKRRMADAGLAAGLKLDEAAALAEPIQALVGKETPGVWDDEEEAWFKPAAQLTKLNVSGKMAGEISAIGVSNNLAPGEAEDQMVYAADVSRYNEAAVAQGVASGGSQFSSYQEALGAVVALGKANVGGVGGASLQPMLEALNNTLGAAGETKYEEMFKKYGLGSFGAKDAQGDYLESYGYDRSMSKAERAEVVSSWDPEYQKEFEQLAQPLTESQNLQKLVDVALSKGDPNKSEQENLKAFADNIGKILGGTDRQDAKALGAAIKQSGAWVGITQDLNEGLAKGAVAQKLESLDQSPKQAAYMRQRNAAAFADYRAYYGDEADEARAVKAKGLALGTERLASGDTSFMGQETVDPETGMAKPLEGAAWWANLTRPSTWIGPAERDREEFDATADFTAGPFKRLPLMMGMVPDAAKEKYYAEKTSENISQGAASMGARDDERIATMENTEATRALTETLRGLSVAPGAVAPVAVGAGAGGGINRNAGE